MLAALQMGELQDSASIYASKGKQHASSRDAQLSSRSEALHEAHLMLAEMNAGAVPFLIRRQ